MCYENNSPHESDMDSECCEHSFPHNQEFPQSPFSSDTASSELEEFEEIEIKAHRRLEVCVDSLESAINAIEGGADELEVCSVLSAGGLTPTAGMVRQIIKYIDNKTAKSGDSVDNQERYPKVNVLIRCRPGFDFIYSESEMETMLADVDMFLALGVDRFVFGALNSAQEVHRDHCERLMLSCAPYPVTFHRAFDVTNDPVEALDTIIEIGFDRLLTSGQRPAATDDEALTLINKLLIQSEGQIEIMPGAGVNPSNVKKLLNVGCKICHSSCKRNKMLPIVHHSLGFSDPEYVFLTDVLIVRELKNIIDSYDVGREGSCSNTGGR